MLKTIFAASFAIAASYLNLALANEFDHLITQAGRDKIAEQLALYKKQKFQPAKFEYTASGPYLDYHRRSYRETDRLKMDDANLPMVKAGDEFQYNPVTLGQYALSAYSDGDNPLFLTATDKLIEMQGPDGAFRYNFAFRHYTNTVNYAPGWVSGMAQGVVLSALARAYSVTKDEKYSAAGNKALDFLQVKHPDGPMTDLSDLKPEWSNKIWFQEYLTDPHAYTLNGYMFTMLGLYDWAEITKSESAKQLFDDSLDTLLLVLPYYDMGNFTAYDLSFITQPKYLERRAPHVAARYHKVHIDLLNALSQITRNEQIAEFETKWRAQVEE